MSRFNLEQQAQQHLNDAARQMKRGDYGSAMLSTRKAMTFLASLQNYERDQQRAQEWRK